MKGIIIQGSARSDGNTAKIALEVKKHTNYSLVHLCKMKIEHFDYNFNNQDDEFSGLIKEIANEYDSIIFITPVYWYTMSGMMKVFFDRISDCLKIDKDTGRKLRGKKMGVLSCSSDDKEYDGFFMPFKQSAHYLGMEYLGEEHTWVENAEIPDEAKKRLNIFLNEFA